MSRVREARLLAFIESTPVVDRFLLKSNGDPGPWGEGGGSSEFFGRMHVGLEQPRL
jgi:hypothetical protein